MAFTDENTTGYTAVELAVLNAKLAAKLAAILAEIDQDDVEVREDAEKAFADAVSRR